MSDAVSLYPHIIMIGAAQIKNDYFYWDDNFIDSNHFKNQII